MENASKALLMAAGVLISLVIIGAFILMMSNVSDYQNKSDVQTSTAQVAEFNNLYDTYNRDNVRGSDMVSLMNRIIDYNNRKSGDGFTEMKIEIAKIPSDILNKLNYDGTNYLVKGNIYTQDNINEIVGKPDGGGTIRNIEKRYEAKYASQLAKEISNIQLIVDKQGVSDSDKVKEFDNEKILPKKLSTYNQNLIGVFKDAKIYYEYVQFKRAVFKCTGTQYDKNSGRIINMKFECTGIGV